MRSAILTLVAVIAAGFAHAEEPSQVSQQLDAYRPFLGTWRYDGPLLEDVPGVGDKESNVVIQFSWRRILDGKVVLEDLSVEHAGGKEVTGKGMIGWHPAGEEIILGHMNSEGGMILGRMEIDSATKTMTMATEVTEGDGSKWSYTDVVKKTGMDTLTWQMKGRSGGPVTGDSPVYTFKRVKRTKGSAVARSGKPAKANEHLEDFAPFIGTWRYEGPLMQAVPGMATEDTQCVLQLSWRWIFDKQAVMNDWRVHFEGGAELAGKSLIRWNAADEKIVSGGMNSMGGMGVSTIVFDRDAKSMTATAGGVNGEGEATTGKNVVTKTGKDTLTFKILERTGGLVDGPSPLYTYKRVKVAKGNKAAK